MESKMKNNSMYNSFKYFLCVEIYIQQFENYIKPYALQGWEL